MKLFLSLSALAAMVMADPGFVALPVHRLPSNSSSGTSAAKAATTKSVPAVPDVLKNSVYQYFVDFTLGNPGQQQTASIDTGSSDLWVYGPGTGAPTTYDPKSSSSSKYVNDGFSISYVDGTSSSGDYYNDEISWGGVDINFQFAVTTQSYSESNSNGVFGIATRNGEASNDGLYDNYPYALKDSGKIDSVAYSLYLDAVDTSSGTLLYGAVDTSKYTGDLKQIPITSNTGFNVNFEVAGHTLNGVLDAGTSLTYLPDDIVATIALGLGAYWDNNAGAYAISGSTEGKSVTYSFDGVDVTVPASELFLDLNGQGNGNYLTILPYSESSGYILLGDSFLRSAYVVYDLSNSQIAIAQANWSPGSPNYQVITDSGIPGAV